MARTMYFTFLAILLAHGVLSVILGWRRNNQGEFYDFERGDVDWSYIFVKIFLFPFCVVVAVKLIRKLKSSCEPEK